VGESLSKDTSMGDRDMKKRTTKGHGKRNYKTGPT